MINLIGVLFTAERLTTSYIILILHRMIARSLLRLRMLFHVKDFSELLLYLFRI